MAGGVRLSFRDSMLVQTYRLPLAQGVVLVRKATLSTLCAYDLPIFPLLGQVIAGKEEKAKASWGKRYEAIISICALALVDPELEVDDFSMPDQAKLANWAVSPKIEPAEVDEMREMSFARAVAGQVAILLDMVCKRYSLRPSALVGITDPTESLDFDLAVGVAGLRAEARQAANARGETIDEDGDAIDAVGEVEVEDAWGNKHRVPRDFLPGIPRGATVVHADQYAKAYGACTLSAGGHGDGTIKPWGQGQSYGSNTGWVGG